MIDLKKIGDACSEIKTGKIEISAKCPNSAFSVSTTTDGSSQTSSAKFDFDNFSIEGTTSSKNDNSFCLSSKKLCGMQNISINLLNNYIKLSHPFSLSHQFKGMPFQLDGSLDFTTDGNSLSGQLCHSFSFDSLISAKYSVAASKKATKVEFSGNLNQIIDFAFSSDGKESSNEISYNFPFGAVGVKTVNSPDNESNSNENTATPKSSINSIGLGLILHDHNKNHQFGMIYDVYKRSADLRIASNFLQKLMELGKLNLFHSNVMLASCTATCFNQKDPILSGASISVLTSNPNSTGLQFTITHDKTFAAKVTTSVNEATAVSACLKVEGNSDLSFGVKVDIKP